MNYFSSDCRFVLSIAFITSITSNGIGLVFIIEFLLIEFTTLAWVEGHVFGEHFLLKRGRTFTSSLICFSIISIGNKHILDLNTLHLISLDLLLHLDFITILLLSKVSINKENDDGFKFKRKLGFIIWW